MVRSGRGEYRGVLRPWGISWCVGQSPVDSALLVYAPTSAPLTIGRASMTLLDGAGCRPRYWPPRCCYRPMPRSAWGAGPIEERHACPIVSGAPVGAYTSRAESTGDWTHHDIPQGRSAPRYSLRPDRTMPSHDQYPETPGAITSTAKHHNSYIYHSRQHSSVIAAKPATSRHRHRW